MLLEEKVEVSIDDEIDTLCLQSKKIKKMLEQWNNVEYSLKEILEERYLFYIVNKYDLEEDLTEFLTKVSDEKDVMNTEKEQNRKETRRERRKEIMSYLEKNCEEKIIDINNYIKLQTQILFNILDVFIEDSKEKLKNKEYEKIRYSFNEYNRKFINNLLDLYEEKNPNYNLIKNRRFDELDDVYIKMLEQGIQSLVDNERNELEAKDISIWRENPRCKKIRCLISSLENKIIYLSDDIQDMEKYNVLCDNLILALTRYDSFLENIIDKRKDYSAEDYKIIEELMKERKKR